MVLVKAETVAKWNRDRFRRYWTKISQQGRGLGPPRIEAEIRRLIQTMAQDCWGAPRIHGEFSKLGFVVSEKTVSRYLPRRPAEPDQVKRRVGRCRRELLDRVVLLGERHLIRLMRATISYYHEDRCHLGLEKDTPDPRPVTVRPSPTAKVLALPRLGGLHHRYEWREAA